LLATQACLRSGAGRVTLRCPSDCLIPVQTAAPEAMASPDECSDRLTEIIKPESYSAIGFGPGVGTDPQTANVLKRLLQDFSGPLVIDADGLNILAEHPTWLQFMPAGTILTPHPGEFERLAGRIADPFERTEALRAFAKRYGCFVALKGRFTCIACPDGQLYFNPTGNNGLAKGGSGDVLTGLICGLLASGHSAMRAVLTGVYVHGLAADLCAREEHVLSMVPGSLPDYFGQAYREIGGTP
ncbi:MAG: NAD(P)H-hydrate dehydratase, partial [Bacteroidota bacterium]